MSHALINRSTDLMRLVEEGFDIEVLCGHLVMNNVPYVGADRQVKRGRLIAALTLSGDKTHRPATHVAMFDGDMPCDSEGSPLNQIHLSSGIQNLGSGLVSRHSFSRKPRQGYANYFEMFTVYVGLISGPARQLDPTASAFSISKEMAA